MTRLRNRPDGFHHRGLKMAYHRLQDGPTFARLDPYCETEQRWLLHSGHVIDVTGAEVRQIAREVNGTVLPDVRSSGGDWDEGRILLIEDRLAALEALFEAMETEAPAETPAPVEPAPAAPAAPASDAQQEIETLKSLLAASEAENIRLQLEATPAPSDVHNFPANLAEPMSGWGAVGEGAEESEDEATARKKKIVDGFVAVLADGRDAADAALRALSSPDRERLFPILNEELGKLKNEEALLGKTIPRRAAVESLLGILARVGEA